MSAHGAETSAQQQDPQPGTAPGAASISPASSLGVFATVRRGFQVSPQILQGVWVTLAIAVVAALGRIVVPITVQQTIDSGILGSGGPDVGRVARFVIAALVVLVVAGVCSAVVNVRLFRTTEAGLASLRVKAFRHVHDLSVLTQNTERRGGLVSRVTGDVDTISMFVQWGGIMLIVSVLQITVAVGLMVFYSWQLTVAVLACFVPLVVVLPRVQKHVNTAYSVVRERVGAMLGAISESIVGAETIRVFGATDRTGRRVNATINATRRAQVRAQTWVSAVFSTGVLVANAVLAVVVVAGTFLGIDGDVTPGKLLAFCFVVQLFTGPVQLATEILNELQNAVAGWRRVLAVIETPVDVPDAGTTVSLRGPAQVRLEQVGFAYPDGPPVLHDVSLDLPAKASVAVVGATGSGKTTIAKLVTRLMDPSTGRVLLDGVDLRDLTASSLRRRVVLVPQEGFLFEGTLAANIAYGIRDEPATTAAATVAAVDRTRIDAVINNVGLEDWVATLPLGLDTEVGQRGEGLSAGERQLVAIMRAHLADADLLVLDEATSAVDPATEVRIARALDSLTAGRSTLTIAHRLSTAQAADLVVVVDAGRVVEVGPHRDLADAGGVYSAMFAAWVAQTR